MPNQDGVTVPLQATPAPVSGRPLGSRYILAEQLGSGAMGRVYRGVVRGGGGDVAVKLLRPDLAANHDIVMRFIRERQLLRSVTHPNVVQVLDLVAESDDLAIVMQYVPGGDMFHTFRGPVPGPQSMRMMAQVADGLLAIHTAGLVHRDLKPSNVLVERESDGHYRLRLTDFGVAEIAAGGQPGLFGTPGYMAPEVGEGAQATPAADVYALGVMLFELFTGVAPFKAENQIGLLLAHARNPVPRPDGLPDPVWNLLRQMLAKEPERRPDAEQVGTALRALATQTPAGPFPVTTVPAVIDLTDSTQRANDSEPRAGLAASAPVAAGVAAGGLGLAATAAVAREADPAPPAGFRTTTLPPSRTPIAPSGRSAPSPSGRPPASAPSAPAPSAPAAGSPAANRLGAGTSSAAPGGAARPTAAGAGRDHGHDVPVAVGLTAAAAAAPAGFRPSGPTIGSTPPGDDVPADGWGPTSLVLGMIGAVAAVAVAVAAFFALREPATALSPSAPASPAPSVPSVEPAVPSVAGSVSSGPSTSALPSASGQPLASSSARPSASVLRPSASVPNASSTPSSSSVAPVRVPPARSALAVTGVAETSATLRLSGVVPRAGDIASITIKGLPNAPTVTPAGAVYDIPVSGLRAATKYDGVTAVVCNTAGLCTSSNAASFSTSEPPPVAPTVGNLTVSGSASRTRVELALSGVAANSGSISSIKVNGAGVDGTMSVGGGNASQYSGSLSGLNAGTTYVVNAEVCNSAGLCSTSNSVTFTTAAPAKPPATPRVSIGRETTSTVPVTVTGVEPVSGNVKSLTVSVGGTEVSLPTGGGTTHSTTVENLSAGTRYSVTATVCNTEDLCTTSAPAIANTVAIATVKPGTVGLRGAVATGRVTVLWTGATGGTADTTCTISVDSRPNQPGIPDQSVGQLPGSFVFLGSSGTSYVATKTCTTPGAPTVTAKSLTMTLP